MSSRRLLSAPRGRQRIARRSATFIVFSSALLLSASLGACNRKDSDNQGQQEKTQAGPLPEPKFSLNQDTEGALYTWVDEQGEFQITDDPESIPPASQKIVRVVVEGHAPGSENHVYVADLSGYASGGALPVRSISREEWEKKGQGQRQKKLAKLAPEPESDDPAPADLGVDAIVYGADWCKPCHLAEDYLKKVGARVVKKDIEEDPGAAAEMRRKLKRAGMGGSSIPVLDVGGTILKGFSQGAVDAALKRAKK